MKNLSVTLSFLFLFIQVGVNQLDAQQIKWYYDVNDASFGNAAAADLDGDGKFEIAFSCYRNDSTLHVLNGEDGSLHWKYNIGGCGDVAPLIYDVDMDDTLDVVVPGSCNPKTFCFNGHTGKVQWATNSSGSDSPPTVGDIDGDSLPEIIHGEFGGHVVCFNGEDGSKAWQITVDGNSWIQTAPALLDIDGDDDLDFIVGNWNFDTAHRVFAYEANTQNLLWSSTLPDDYMYHGASFADIDLDGKPEIVIGCYDGKLRVFEAESGKLKWDYSVQNSFYIGAPTSLGDLNKDGKLDIVFMDAWTVEAVDAGGNQLWTYTNPDLGQSFRGAALADVNGDQYLDVTYGTSKGDVIVLNGLNGQVLYTVDLEAHYGDTFEIDHGPLVADFDGDSIIDVFVVGGHAEYPDIWKNYGRAYMISLGPGNGPDWTMFRRDHVRSACVCEDTGLLAARPIDREVFVTIYPNPGRDEIFIDGDLESGSTFMLFDLNGRLAKEARIDSDQKINVSGLPKGFYAWKIIDASGDRFASGKWLKR